MPQTRTAVLSAVRGGALGVALFALLWVDRFAMTGIRADLARGIVVLFAIGACLPRSRLHAAAGAGVDVALGSLR